MLDSLLHQPVISQEQSRAEVSVKSIKNKQSCETERLQED